MQITVEKLKKEDLESYKALIDAGLGPSQPLEVFKARYDPDHPSCHIRVAKKNGEIIGTLTFYQIDLFTFSFQPTLEIYNVVVAKAHRGSAAAQLLFDDMKAFAKAHGYVSVAVTCLADATRAHRFYEKMGFEKLDRERFLLTV